MNAHEWIATGLGWYLFAAVFIVLWWVAPRTGSPHLKAFEKGLALFIALNYAFYHVSAAVLVIGPCKIPCLSTCATSPN